MLSAMPRIRYPFAGAFAALMLLAAYVGLTPLQISAINDKVLHFVVFFLISLTLYWAVDLPRRLLFKLVVGSSLALAVGSELVQAALPNGREFDPVDIAANCLGSALAVGACTWYHKRMLERKRQRKLQGYGPVHPEDVEDIELGESSYEGQELGVVTEDDDDGGEAWDDMDGNGTAEHDTQEPKAKD